MARRQTISWAELRVGVLVIASFALLAAAIFFVGGEAGFFTPKYTVTAYFPSVNGMNNGAEVWLEGVTVGNVSSVGVTNLPEPERSVAVEMSLDLEFQEIILSDSIMTIGSIGLLGDSIVEIEKGPGLGDSIPDGGTIQGQTTGDIRELITGTNDIIANLEVLSEEIQEIAGQIRQGEGTLGKMLTDTSIYDNANATVEEVRLLVENARTGDGTIGSLMNDRDLYDRMNEAVQRIDVLVTKVESGDGTLGKFINDPSVYDRANELVGRMNNVVARLEMGEGTLGKLSRDDALYDDLRTATEEVSTMVSNVANSEGTLGKLINEPALYDNTNQTISEMLKLMYDFRQDPRKFLTINFRLF